MFVNNASVCTYTQMQTMVNTWVKPKEWPSSHATPSHPLPQQHQPLSKCQGTRGASHRSQQPPPPLVPPPAPPPQDDKSNGSAAAGVMGGMKKFQMKISGGTSAVSKNAGPLDGVHEEENNAHSGGKTTGQEDQSSGTAHSHSHTNENRRKRHHGKSRRKRYVYLHKNFLMARIL